MTDRRAAEIMYPDQGKPWRIELKYKTIEHRGHAYLALVDGNNKLVRGLHGLGFSKHTGKDGGQIQNSNSFIYTVGKAQGFDLDRAIKDANMSPRVLSGWGRDLLDPKYERYVAPPTFPVRDAP